MRLEKIEENNKNARLTVPCGTNTIPRNKPQFRSMLQEYVSCIKNNERIISLFSVISYRG